MILETVIVSWTVCRSCGWTLLSPIVSVRLKLSSGEYHRQLCPVSVLLPVPMDPVDRPTLYREGRKRPIRSQLEPTPRGTVLWWFVQNLPAQQEREFILTTGQRERQPRARVKVRRRVERGFELFRADGRALAVTFNDPTGLGISVSAEGTTPFSLLHQNGWEQGFTARPAAKPRIFQGTVCSMIIFDRRIHDSHGVIWEERIRVRLFDGPADVLTFDLLTSVTASTTKLAVGSGPQPTGLTGDSRLRPQLQLKVPESWQQIHVSPGWKLAEGEHRSGPFATCVGTEQAVTVLAAESNYGFPPTWCLEQAQLLAHPHLGPQGLATLPLGATADFHFRFIVHPSARAHRFATARFFDLVCPPEAYAEEETASPTQNEPPNPG